MWGFIFGGNAGHAAQRIAGEKSPAFPIPDKISEKIGEKHFIVDTQGHFETTRKIADEGIREGYLKYESYCRVNGYIHHLYSQQFYPDI